jgi:hypothetical protein
MLDSVGETGSDWSHMYALCPIREGWPMGKCKGRLICSRARSMQASLNIWLPWERYITGTRGKNGVDESLQSVQIKYMHS